MTDRIIAPDGPFKIDMVVYYQNAEGTIAKARYDLPSGIVPTAAMILDAFKEIEDSGLIPDGFVRMDRHEFVNELIAEH